MVCISFGCPGHRKVMVRSAVPADSFVDAPALPGPGARPSPDGAECLMGRHRGTGQLLIFGRLEAPRAWSLAEPTLRFASGRDLLGSGGAESVATVCVARTDGHCVPSPHGPRRGAWCKGCWQMRAAVNLPEEIRIPVLGSAVLLSRSTVGKAQNPARLLSPGKPGTLLRPCQGLVICTGPPWVRSDPVAGVAMFTPARQKQAPLPRSRKRSRRPQHCVTLVVGVVDPGGGEVTEPTVCLVGNSGVPSTVAGLVTS